jgi:hypothetical protein
MSQPCAQAGPGRTYGMANYRLGVQLRGRAEGDLEMIQEERPLV